MQCKLRKIQVEFLNEKKEDRKSNQHFTTREKSPGPGDKEIVHS